MRLLPVGVSLAGCVLLSAIYVVRPANVDPVTIWPFWFWSVPGAALGLLGLSRQTWRWNVATVVLWALNTCWIAEEPRSVLRACLGPQTASRAQPGFLRVVTLNCAGGRTEPVVDALAQDPDILFLQEMPGRNQLARLLESRPGWELATGMDAAIAALGEVQEQPLTRDESLFMCVVRVVPARLRPPTEIAALSTRLFLPQLRFDLWRPSVWRGAAQVRALRAEQVTYLTTHVAAAARAPVILGGDFNTPAGDSLLRPLRPHLRDAFSEAGSGWPNTITDEHPMSRVDQVWVSDQFQVLGGRVVYTQHSDHRMVVMDLALH